MKRATDTESRQPSLFDLDPGRVEVGEPMWARATWQEVPQARFDSWSVGMQLAYCARRDEASAAEAYEPWW
jgi:hypothetical protein